MTIHDVLPRGENARSQYFSVGAQITVMLTTGKLICLTCIKPDCAHAKLVAEYLDAEAFLGGTHAAA